MQASVGQQRPGAGDSSKHTHITCTTPHTSHTTHLTHFTHHTAPHHTAHTPHTPVFPAPSQTQGSVSQLALSPLTAESGWQKTGPADKRRTEGGWEELCCCKEGMQDTHCSPLLGQVAQDVVDTARRQQLCKGSHPSPTSSFPLLPLAEAHVQQPVCFVQDQYLKQAHSTCQLTLPLAQHFAQMSRRGHHNVGAVGRAAEAPSRDHTS